MPSPFPGMDPYLENPTLWPDVHHELISDLRAELNLRLRPRYLATVEERVYISDEYDPGRRVLIPDVRIATQDWTLRPTWPAWDGKAVGVVEPVEVTTLIDEEIREARIVIADADQQLPVTVIEFLSPANKVFRSAGQQSYELKRREAMTASTHLVEVDLLRRGQRIFVRESLPPHDYQVHISRSTPRGRRARLWPIPLPVPLPVIPIPLTGSDPDLGLDLQAILVTAYDRGGYDGRIRYDLDPVPPLEGPASDWARQLCAGRDK